MPIGMIAGAVLGIAGAGVQAYGQKQAAEDARKANKQRSAIEEVHNRKAAVNTLRKARIARATMLASATNTGAKGSGEQGALGSIQTQTASSLGFQNVNAQSSRNISRTLNSQTKAEELAGLGGAISGVGKDIFGYSSGFG